MIMQKTVSKSLCALKWGVISLIGLCFLIIFLSFFALQAGSLWLKTDNGARWLEGQITSISKDAPYEIEVSNVHLMSLSTYKAGSILIKEKGEDTLIARIDGARLHVSSLSLLRKELGLSISAQELHLENLPKAPEETKADNPKTVPFTLTLPETLPNLYLNTLSLDALSIKNLSLSDNIIAGGFKTGVRLIAEAKLAPEAANIEAQLRLSDASAFEKFLPQTVALSAMVNTASQDEVAHADLNINNNSYDVDFKFSQNTQKTARYDLKASLKDSQQIEPTIQSAFLALSASGTEMLEGELRAEAIVQDNKINVASPLLVKDQKITLADIKGSAAQAVLGGDLLFDLQSNLASGQLQATLKNADMLKAFIGEALTFNAANASVKLAPSAEGKQSAALSLSASNIAASEASFQSFNAQAALTDIAEIKEPEVTAKLESGRYQSVQINNITLTVQPKLNAEQTKVDAINWNLSGTGRDRYDFTLSADGEATFAPDTWSVALAEMRAQFGDGTITAQGIASSEKLDMSGTINNLTLDSIPTLPQLSVAPTFKSGRFALTQTLQAPVISLSTTTSTQAGGAQFNVNSNANYAGEKLSLTANGSGGGVEKFSLNAAVPLSLSLYPFAFNLDKGAPLSGNMVANANAVTLFDMAQLSQYDVGGRLNANADISGTLNAPQINGRLTTSDFNIFDPTSNIHLKDIKTDIVLNNKTVQIRSLTSRDENNGRLNVAGTMAFDDPQNPVFNIAARATSYHLLHGQNYNGTLDADLNIVTRTDTHSITGDIVADEIQISLPDQFGKSIPKVNIIEDEAEEGPSILERILLDITFDANDKIFVRGRGLDAEFGGKIAITNTAKTPLFDGSLSAKRGRLDMFGKRFELDRAKLRFQGEVPPSPYLDILAITNADGVKGQIALTGKVTEPSLGLSSVPSLPQDEILSRILFGADPSKISPFQALQLANSLAELSGKSTGPKIDPLGTLRDTTGLDDLRVDSGEDGPTVGAGKYLSDNVYLGFEQGGGDEPTTAATVEVELTPNITVESELGNSTAGGGVKWEWDY